MSLDNVKNIVLVLSGKGGVGKSSVTVQLALSLARTPHTPPLKIGILDVDLTGPNIPRMLNLEASKVHQTPSGWLPVALPPSNDPSHGTIAVMSLGFLLRDRGDSVVWRGPKKTAMVRQFLTDVMWGELDYLLIDTPPGTSDEHISLAETLVPLGPRGAVIVTTPQAVATADVKKELNFCKKVGLEVLGVVENMSGFVCPHCAECTNIFSSGGGAVMAQQFNVDYWGSVPIDPTFVMLIEQRETDAPSTTSETATSTHPPPDLTKGLLERYGDSALCPVFKGITDKLMQKVAVVAARGSL